MVLFVIGIFVGGFAGFICAGLMGAASRSDNMLEHERFMRVTAVR